MSVKVAVVPFVAAASDPTGARLGAGPELEDVDDDEVLDDVVEELDVVFDVEDVEEDVEGDGVLSPPSVHPAKARATTIKKAARARIQTPLRRRSYLSNLAGLSQRPWI